MDRIQTDSILFRTIPPQLETVLRQFDYEEISRQGSVYGTVITYINEYVANNVYDYIMHWAKNNYLGCDPSNIIPNYVDETQLRNPYGSRTSPVRYTAPAPPILRSYFTYKLPSMSYQSGGDIVKNYFTYAPPVKDNQNEPVVNLYQPVQSQMSRNLDHSLRELGTNNDGASSRRGRNTRHTTPSQSYRSHPYNGQHSTQTHVPAYGTDSFSRRSRNRSVRGGSSSRKTYSDFRQ